MKGVIFFVLLVILGSIVSLKTKSSIKQMSQEEIQECYNQCKSTYDTLKLCCSRLENSLQQDIADDLLGKGNGNGRGRGRGRGRN